MSNRKTIPGLRDFLKDLKTIREKHQVTHEQVFAATKVNVQLIEEFETNGLVDHNLFNHLYLRAFVRSYSEIVGINPDKTVAYYESAIKGGYERQLAISYLDFERPPRPVRLSEVEQKVSEEEAHQPIEVATESFTEDEKAKAKALPEEIEEEVETPANVSAKARSQVEQALLDPEEEVSVWQRIQHVPFLGELINTARKGMRLQAGTPSQNSTLQWGLVGSVLVILSLLLFFLLRGGGEYGSTTDETPAESVNPDEMSAMPPTTQAVPATTDPIFETLPPDLISSIVDADSIPVWIVATDDRLSPFRVQVDNDLRRPYWLDQGDSSVFYFVRRMAIEEGLDVMRIQVDSFQYSSSFVDASGRLIITRDSLRGFLQQITFTP